MNLVNELTRDITKSLVARSSQLEVTSQHGATKVIRARLNLLAGPIARAAGQAAGQSVREVMRREGSPDQPRALQVDIERFVRAAALPVIIKILAKYYD